MKAKSPQLNALRKKISAEEAANAFAVIVPHRIGSLSENDKDRVLAFAIDTLVKGRSQYDRLAKLFAELLLVYELQNVPVSDQ